MARVRSATAADLGRIVEIASESGGASQWSMEDYEKLFTPETMQKSEVLVAEDAGKVIGFLVARAVDIEWDIENIAVSPAARRQGIGSQMLAEFLNRARQSGGATVFLEVRESNIPARKLYETMGFALSGRRKEYYRSPAEDALIMKLLFHA